jgi:hypothetical protein
MLEELLLYCEEAQDKGGNFTYGYLFLAFTMLKWMPLTGRTLALEYKGHLENMFELWHSRTDLENTSFNNTTFSKQYNKLINSTQSFCILQELLKFNMRNIAFKMNRHHTFVWLRYANREDFHSRMMSFYLDEEDFNKEVILWPGVKCKPHKSRMHYVLLVELLKKKGKEAGVGLSLGS